MYMLTISQANSVTRKYGDYAWLLTVKRRFKMMGVRAEYTIERADDFLLQDNELLVPLDDVDGEWDECETVDI